MNRLLTKTEAAAARLLEISATKKALEAEEQELRGTIQEWYEKTNEKMVGEKYQIVVRSNAPRLVDGDGKAPKPAIIDELMKSLPRACVKRSPDLMAIEARLLADEQLHASFITLGVTLDRSTTYSVKHA